jgi:hypothetical protein
MNHPKGFIVDDKGNIYVAYAINMAIRKISNTRLGALANYFYHCMFSSHIYANDILLVLIFCYFYYFVPYICMNKNFCISVMV